MSTETVGFHASDDLTNNTLFRVTIGNHWYNAPSSFPDAAGGLYGKLYQQAHLLPTTKLTVASGQQIAVFDANLKANETGADLINDLEKLGSQWAFVVRLEMLTPSQRAESSGSAGATDRNVAVDAAEAQSNTSGVLAKFMHDLSALGDVVKWGGIGVVVLTALYFGAPYLSRKK